jgi:hypothetical protein
LLLDPVSYENFNVPIQLPQHAREKFKLQQAQMAAPGADSDPGA